MAIYTYKVLMSFDVTTRDETPPHSLRFAINKWLAEAASGLLSYEDGNIRDPQDSSVKIARVESARPTLTLDALYNSEAELEDASDQTLVDPVDELLEERGVDPFGLYPG